MWPGNTRDNKCSDQIKPVLIQSGLKGLAHNITKCFKKCISQTLRGKCDIIKQIQYHIYGCHMFYCWMLLISYFNRFRFQAKYQLTFPPPFSKYKSVSTGKAEMYVCLWFDLMKVDTHSPMFKSVRLANKDGLWWSCQTREEKQTLRGASPALWHLLMPLNGCS